MLYRKFYEVDDINSKNMDNATHIFNRIIMLCSDEYKIDEEDILAAIRSMEVTRPIEAVALDIVAYNFIHNRAETDLSDHVTDLDMADTFSYMACESFADECDYLYETVRGGSFDGDCVKRIMLRCVANVNIGASLSKFNEELGMSEEDYKKKRAKLFIKFIRTVCNLKFKN